MMFKAYKCFSVIKHRPSPFRASGAFISRRIPTESLDYASTPINTSWKLSVSRKRKMSKCDTLLEEGLQTELIFKAHLKVLRMALQQQLQETKRKQTEELDKRIHQNTLFSTDTSQKYEEERFGARRSTPASSLISDKKTSLCCKQRPNLFSLSLVPSANSKRCSVSAQQCERCASSKTTQQIKEEEAEAECKKKFSAVPVAGHVIQPIYQEMMELREKERKQGHEQRKKFLLSIQKPFSFEQRNKNKREKETAIVSEDPKNSVPIQKTSHRNMKDLREDKGRFSFSLELYCFQIHTVNQILQVGQIN
ncbi:hypothetical protein ATANTOWER_020241 [Ataeniobius toweri]|uniref:Uncharacterized protein n=1 Tax=Ataeniobius toweri TaxID=208326 RepID=A0ABU7CC12_9TELE|nr:hypothetical protein [Ataeniobius toweri]